LRLGRCRRPKPGGEQNGELEHGTVLHEAPQRE
jgi:hypothetical protein